LTDVARLLGLPTDDVPGQVVVTGVSLASGSVRAGDLYAALPGSRTHGARYGDQAVAAGCAAVLTDPEGAAIVGGIGLPILVVERPRAVLGEVAALVYGRPTESLTVVGVTGTHGKTTTTQLIAHAAGYAGRTTAVVGTMGTWIAGEPVGSALTTPEAPDLQALFAVMLEQQVEVCAIEVSSHALVMGRVDGVVFDLAVFTNLGRDHLDFHTDMEDYFAAKARLFTAARARSGLVCVDDPYGARLAGRAEIPLRTLSTGSGGSTRADWHAAMDVAASSPQETSFTVSGPDGLPRRGSVAMPGEFNVANALAAIAVCTEVGLDVDVAIRGVAAAPPIGGRMERVEAGADIAVIVDYAHKPDALKAVLAALRPVTPGRLVLVVGAGGDRDRGKRPIMGEVGATHADVLVVTDDNPRSEDPAAIRAEIVAGAGADRGDAVSAEVVEVGDRRAAIRYAVGSARPGDTVLIAGKGHETGQEVGGEVVSFDDRREARAALGDRSGTAS